MDALPPSGTVTLLFSDVEGSTVLLSRLGPSYADALDGQRGVLRAAWAAYAGVEMGTEGDSFFVAFPTAPAAVAAATQAQRGLSAFTWPQGEQVRVRMGIHTGSPTVHDEGYVGMDVHRAARIAGAAHGGQVVVSSSTAELVRGDLPETVTLRDLGSHQLKDLSSPEHLFQLVIEGCQVEFPALRSLGAASSLPVPATPLLGRDGELTDLDALLRSPGVRLVTLTGPGGSGKTRLAIGLARQLTDAFPDGVYFVPLAAVTTAEVMWTTIGEVLDVPSEDRTPPKVMDHLAHRSVLLIVDNLEQLESADSVVAQLIPRAPKLVVIATSRRPLHLSGEYEHAVPPLELPTDDSVDAVQASGAGQLFLQQARRVRRGFVVDPGNAADLAAVCRRLDGLPLAVELAAARSKLLSPRALLARLDSALDITAAGRQVPSRQQTLRDTIGWSYDLLTAQHQTCFRRLGVFAGGADLDAIMAVTADEHATADPLELVSDLADASMLTVSETPDGEPRFAMLETIRVYALDQLTANGERDHTQALHAHHYLNIAEKTRPLLRGGQVAEARTWFETEQDNLRTALTWAFRPDEAITPSEEGVRLGLRLCREAFYFWRASGYLAEMRRWLELAVECGGEGDRPELAQCLRRLAECLNRLGEYDRACEVARADVDMTRRLGDRAELSQALYVMAAMATDAGQTVAARAAYEEALDLARASGNKQLVMAVLVNFALFESFAPNLVRSLEMDTEGLAIARELGNLSTALVHERNMACTLRKLGRLEEARDMVRHAVPQCVKHYSSHDLADVAEDYGAILADLGHWATAVRLFGAADITRERSGVPRRQWQEDDLAEPIAKTHEALTAQGWNDAYQAGRTIPIEDALTQACADDTQL